MITLKESGDASRPRRSAWCRPAGLLLAAVVPTLAGAVLAPTRVDLTIRHDAAGRELVLELGPFELPARASHHDIEQPETQVAAVPVAGWLHGYRIDLVDRHGEPVPPDIIHHVNIITPDRRELFSQIMLRLGAAGQETGEVRLPRFLGHPLEAGQNVMVSAMLHNPTAVSYEGVHLRIHVPFTAKRRWFAPVSVYPVYLDVMPPASIHAYDLQPGISEQSWEGSPAVAGRLLGVGGHLHRYGVALRLEDVTRGRVLWEARPTVNEGGEVIGMPTKRFFWTLGVPLRPDHVYRLTAVYDNPTGQLIPLGAMGTLGGVFLPSRGQRWPASDPDHPEYQLDVQLVSEVGYEDPMHGEAAAGGHGHDGHDHQH